MYEAGSVPLSGELKFESNKKGLFILRTYKKKWKVYASDPTQTETSMEVILNGNKREIKLPEGEYKGTVAMFSEWLVEQNHSYEENIDEMEMTWK